jgi:hypothetical protein
MELDGALYKGPQRPLAASGKKTPQGRAKEWCELNQGD